MAGGGAVGVVKEQEGGGGRKRKGVERREGVGRRRKGAERTRGWGEGRGGEEKGRGGEKGGGGEEKGGGGENSMYLHTSQNIPKYQCVISGVHHQSTESACIKMSSVHEDTAFREGGDQEVCLWGGGVEVDLHGMESIWGVRNGMNGRAYDCQTHYAISNHTHVHTLHTHTDTHTHIAHTHKHTHIHTLHTHTSMSFVSSSTTLEWEESTTGRTDVWTTE